jgi:hypothetical protein
MFRSLVLLALLGPIAMVSSSNAALTQERPVDLQNDPRLTRKLSLPGDTLRLQQVVKTLGEVTEVDILVQGDLLRRPVAITVKNKTAADILEQLGLLFGGTWLRRGDSYLLVTDEVTARMITAHRADAATDREEQALFRSITPQQLARLREGKTVGYERLTPSQKRLVLTIARDRFLKQPEQYPSSILAGKGVELFRTIVATTGAGGRPVLTFSPNDPNLRNPSTIELGVPMIADNGELTQVSLATVPMVW